MKKLIIAVLMTLFVTSLHTQWVSNFQPGYQTDVNLSGAKGLSISADNSGSCYVTGYAYDPTGANDILVIKFNADGDTAWTRTFGGSENQNDQGNGVGLDSYGNIYVVGTSAYTSTSSDITLLKYDPNGNLLWSKTYFSAEQYTEDKGLGIVVDDQNNIYITGYSTNYDGYADIVTQKYDTDGNLLWSLLEDGSTDRNSKGIALALDNSGNICVTGYVAAANGTTDMALLKYSVSGELIWADYYNGGGDGEDKAFGIAVDDEDRIIIGGYITNSSIDFAVLQYDAAGQLQWLRSYNGSGNSADKAFGIAVDDEDAIYVTGYETDLYNGSNYLTMKFSPSGNNEWTSVYNGTGNGNDKANSIGIAYSNGQRYVIVTGESMGSDNMDYATVQYNYSSGAENKVSRYSMNSGSQDAAQDIAISEDGNIYITGYSDLLNDAGISSYATTVMYAIERPGEITNNSPSKFSLHQNYPNPFNPTTTIKFDIASASYVKLEVFDILGRSIQILVDGNLTAGTYNVQFSSSTLASGVYFYKLSSQGNTQIRKMTLIK